ncbi:RAD23 family protein [Rhodococcus artemisiae]|uniref:Mce-associated membrane protein n=1 Tax=Rhodococcus artemisiae TaxID=714159 RepID=A0ABU7LJK6_9NOCA|nr:hypothetical protein [Rhodococcus artemisiae]MEE2061757.1 hypothetical protein [Rhodococcus artemisiae]
MALIGVAVGALTIAGCSSESEQDRTSSSSAAQPSTSTAAWPPTEASETPETSAAPAAPTVDTADPGELGATVVQAWFSYDTSTDTNRNVAPVRAADLGVLTDELDAQVRADAEVSVKATGEWALWSSQGATVTAVAVEVPNQGQENTETKYHGMYEVTSTVTDSSGTETGSDVQYVAVVLTDNGDGWRVSSVSTL